MPITRRALFGSLALPIGAVAGCYALSQISADPIGSAQSRTLSTGELMKAGPLREEAEGRTDAPATIIEYASMTCPHCAAFDVNVLPALQTRYIRTGKVRYILREFPLDPLAAAGFMLARCASDDKYFDMVHVLFARQKEWVVPKPLPPLWGIAKEAGFRQATFDACLANKDLLAKIDAVRQRAATEYGVDSTPTFFINGKAYRGEMSFDQLEQALRPYLSS
jgi:protein-disulfide isomerase